MKLKQPIPASEEQLPCRTTESAQIACRASSNFEWRAACAAINLYSKTHRRSSAFLNSIRRITKR